MVRGLWVVLLGTVGCSEHVRGELYVGPPEGTGRMFAPSECNSGAETGFFGVDLWDDDDHLARFVSFDGDPALVVFERYGAFEAFRIRPSDCELFEGAMNRQTQRGSDATRVEGHLTLNCTAPSGDIIEGSLTFERCGDPSDDDECDDG
jgi:hypothetical protein